MAAAERARSVRRSVNVWADFLGAATTMAASQANTHAMNNRALDAAVKATPGVGTTLALGSKGVEIGAGAIEIGKKAVVASATPDASPEYETAPVAAHSNSVPLEPFLARCDKEEQLATQRFENYLDFGKKYDTPSADAVIDLGETKMSWCMIYKLETAGDDSQQHQDVAADGSGLLVPCECMDLCQRLWAVDVEVHCKLSANHSEIFITVGLTYEMLVDEAQFVNLPMRLNDTMGSARFESDKMHH